MLTLILFRHAKAERGGAGVPDEKRPLAERGRRTADAMGRRLATEGLMPDLVLCSPATRTLETLALAAPHWAPAPRTSIVADLYRLMSASYLDLVRAAPPARRLMLVAHNSAIETTAREFTGEGGGTALPGLASGFPTAAIAVFDFDVDNWADVAAGQGRLTAFLTAE
jgi:phosphohistidine phosphatase